MYGALLFALIAEVLPDFFNRYGLRAIRKPFPLAKMFASLFLIFWGLEIVFFAINSNPSDPRSLKATSLSLTAHGLAFVCMGLVMNLIILAWIHTIERTRSLERVRWVRPFKIVAILLAVCIVLLHAANLPLVLLPSLKEISEALNTLKLSISLIFLLLMIAVSITVLVRGRYLWGPESIFRVVRFKSRVFIADVIILVLYVTVALSSLAIPDGPWKTLGLYLVFSLAAWMYLVIALVFLQTNLFKKGVLCYGCQSKHRSKGTTKRTSEAMKEESHVRSMSTVSTMSMESTAATNSNPTDTTALK
jgi:hypothetical protein